MVSMARTLASPARGPRPPLSPPLEVSESKLVIRALKALTKVCVFSLVAFWSWPTSMVSGASPLLCALLKVRLTPSMMLSKVLLVLVSSIPVSPPRRTMASLATDSSCRPATAPSTAALPLALRLMAWSAPVFSLVSTRLTWPLLRTRVALTPLLSVAPLMAAASSSSEIGRAHV